MRTDLNPADCFSRPGEEEKQGEAAHLRRQWRLRNAPAVFPAQVAADPEAWVAAVRAALAPVKSFTRHEQAKLAARLGAVDATTLAEQLRKVTFASRDKQITLGWYADRRQGRVAMATDYHVGLAQLLLRAARVHLRRASCTTLLLRRGAIPERPRGAAKLTAMATIHNVDEPGEAVCSWGPSPREEPAPRVTQGDIVACFYVLPLDGINDRRAASKLARIGFPIWPATELE